MTRRVFTRLEELEKASAAAAAQRERTRPRDTRVLDELVAKAKAWCADPQNQKWLAEQTPEFLYQRVQSLRAYLQARASGHFQQRPADKAAT